MNIKKKEHAHKDFEISNTNFPISISISDTKGHSKDDVVRIARVLFAGVSDLKYCDCPNSKPGIISYDPFDHLPGCRFRKKLRTKRYTINTKVDTDGSSREGYSLGLAMY